MLFRMTLLHRVELERHLGLLVRSVVLVDQVLAGRLVNGSDSDFVGADGCVLVPLGNCGVELLDAGTERRLVGLVLRITRLGKLVSLRRRLDVGHGFFRHLLLKSISGQTHSDTARYI